MARISYKNNTHLAHSSDQNLSIISDDNISITHTGADPGFQVTGGGAHLKKWRRAEGGAKNVGVFRVKNHDFTPKNNIFTNFKGGVPP